MKQTRYSRKQIKEQHMRYAEMLFDYWVTNHGGDWEQRMYHHLFQHYSLYLDGA